MSFPSVCFKCVDTQCTLVISYRADVPCSGLFPSSDSFKHVCDLCLFCYPDVCFISRFVIFNVHLSICVCAAARLFFARVVSVYVSAPYVIAGSKHEW